MAQDTLLGFPAHTLPYRCGGFTTLSTVSNKGRKAALISYFFYISLTELCYNIFKRIKIRSRPFCSLFF